MPAALETGVFSNNETTWHGEGTTTEHKIYDLQEALTLSGLDWTASKRPLYVEHTPGSTPVEMPGYYAVHRDTDDQLLNPCVSKNYEILQNKDAFTFFEPFLHEKDCFINSAISLQSGRKVCVLAQINDHIREIVKDDPVESYILLSTSHDGSLSTSVRFTFQRVVCLNTLYAALAEDRAFKVVRHTSSQMEQLSAIQNSINIFRRTFEDEVTDYKALAKKEVKLNDVRSYLEKVFAKDIEAAAQRLEVPLSEVKLEDARMPKKCLENFLFTPDLQTEGVINTAWAAFNSVTEAVKNRSSNPDNRMNSIWFGSDSRVIHKAKELALAI